MCHLKTVGKTTFLVMGVMRISDTGVKEDSVFLVEFGPVTEDGVDDCSVDLIFRILSKKNLQKVFTRLVLFVQSGRTTTEDLCNIFLKQFHKALGFP